MRALQALHRCSLRLADAKLGAVHALLSSASDRLLSVVTSDHGELFGEDRLISHQFSLRNELLEVPLLAHGLADRAPARIDTPVQGIDIAPSILAWAGIEAGEGLAGRPLPAAGESAEPRAIVSEYADYASLRAETEAWCQQMKGYSGQTLRATKKSLNFESDELYASWQQGMELLAEIWGSDESLEGMNAFLEKRKPDFHQFRLGRKEKVDTYLNDLANDRNQSAEKFGS